MADILKIKKLNKKIMKLENKARAMQLHMMKHDIAHDELSRLRQELCRVATELAEARKELMAEQGSK
jgi:hypothetical protein